MKLKKLLKKLSEFALLLSMLGSVCAQTIEVEVIDGATREKRMYSGGSSDFRIPVEFVHGWSHCIAKKIKKVQFYGEMARAEFYCFSKSGTAQSVACVTAKGAIEVVPLNLFGGTFRFVDDDNISAASFADITITCRY